MQKGVYPCKYLDDCKKFNEATCEKEDFYSHLNMEDIIDVDYEHAKRVCQDFDMTKWGKYDLYIIVSWCIWESLEYVLTLLIF